MSQAVQFQTFQVDDFKTQAGVEKLNLLLQQMAYQIQLLTGTLGPIPLDNDINLGGKWKVTNAKP